MLVFSNKTKGIFLANLGKMNKINLKGYDFFEVEKIIKKQLVFVFKNYTV